MIVLEREIPLERRMVLFDHLYDATQASLLISSLEVA